MRSTQTEVLIVGAGAAGLVLAIDLARRGVAFRLIEKLDGPFIGSKGKGLQPRTLEVFEDLGLVGPILEAGAVYPPVWTYDGDQVVSRAQSEVRSATVSEPYPNSLMLPQWKTEAALRDRLAKLGAEPQYGVELTGFDDDGLEVRATLGSSAGSEVVACRYLVGTDGGRSFVRRALGVGFPGERRSFRMALADMAIDNLTREAWSRWPKAPGGQLSLCPLAGTNLFQVAAEIGADQTPDLSREFFQDLIAARSGRGDLIGYEPGWTSLYNASFHLADRYRVGRVFIAGDAAHAHPPTGGQGLNTAVQDGYNLGWKLAHVLAGAPEALLDTYEVERRPIAAGVLDLSAGLLDAMNRRHDMRRGRDTLQLDLTYRGSPLAVDARADAGGVQAGDRAPDASFRKASGEQVRLFDVVQGPQFTLLAYDAAAEIRALGLGSGAHLDVVTVASAPGGGDLADAEGSFRAAYDLGGGELLLVRPDGYLGAIAGANQGAAITDYLNRWAAPAEPPANSLLSKERQDARTP